MNFALHPTVIERRKASAQRAIQTRQRRRINRIEQLAELIAKGDHLGPFPRCRVCGRSLTDQASIDRAIGSECLGAITDAIERKRSAA